MSDSNASSTPPANPSKVHPSGSARMINAAIGIVIVFVIALLVNYVFGMFNPRVDLTENKVFTLSEGTKSILERVDTPVTVRFYAIDDTEYVGSFYDSMARNVENLLAEYEGSAGGNITVKRFNPEPDTDAEDNAVFDGLRQGVSQQTGNPIYFGISVECLDRKETIPFIPNRPESLLEYDISRAILRAHDGSGKKIRIMTTMQIGGGFSGGFNAPPKQPWYLVQQLRRDYEVEFLPATAEEIPADTEALIVLHPFDVGDEAQFAIDQYLLKGGNVIVAVDPNFFAARFMTQGQPPNPMMPQAAGGPAPTSDLDKLFGAWGVVYDSSKVLADTVFQTQIQSGYSPTVLSVPQEAMNDTDPVTMNLNDIFLIMPGSFELVEKTGISHEVLMHSSPSSQMVSTLDADPTQKESVERLRRGFKASGTPLTIAARLSGSFTTAFPNGKPGQADEASAEEGDDKEEEASEEEKKEEAPALKKSEKDGVVLLFADADFVYDQFSTRPVQNMLSGQVELRPNNDNLALFENSVELALGGSELISVRSRASDRRVFTKLNEWQRAAEEEFQDDLAKFETEVRDVETNINQILSQQPENIEEAIVSPEVQAELQKLQESQASMNKKVRALRKEMKREFDLAQLMIKLLTTGLIPLLVALFGVGLAISRKFRTAAK